MLKLGSLRWKAKCPRHPRFNPETHGADAIRGNCQRCLQLLEISATYQRTLHLIRAFGSPATPRSKSQSQNNDHNSSEDQLALFANQPTDPGPA